MQQNVIDIHEVRKRHRGGVEALRGISLQVPQGQIFGLLGPNGAGKSTLVKILTRIIKPTHCLGTMLGQPVGDRATLAKIGYLPEHANFPPYLKGREVVRYVAGLCGVSHHQAKKKTEELLEMVGMTQWGNKTMKTYSKGMKQRIGLAQALVNDPELIFLDEPTDGVDVQGRLEMRGFLKDLRDQGRTIFVNSHLLGELELICDGVAILNQGQIVRQGTVKDLTEKTRHFTIRTDGEIPASLREKIENADTTVSAYQITTYCDTAVQLQPMVDLLRAENCVIVELKESRQSLEELFMEAVDSQAVGGVQTKAQPPVIPTKGASV